MLKGHLCRRVSSFAQKSEFINWDSLRFYHVFRDKEGRAEKTETWASGSPSKKFLVWLNPKGHQEQRAEKPTNTFQTTSHPPDLTAKIPRIWTPSCASKLKTLESTRMLTNFFANMHFTICGLSETGFPPRVNALRWFCQCVSMLIIILPFQLPEFCCLNSTKISDTPIWVCLKIVYPYTQWFCWSLSLLNGYNWGYTSFSDTPIYSRPQKTIDKPWPSVSTASRNDGFQRPRPGENTLAVPLLTSPLALVPDAVSRGLMGWKKNRATWGPKVSKGNCMKWITRRLWKIMEDYGRLWKIVSW